MFWNYLVMLIQLALVVGIIIGNIFVPVINPFLLILTIPLSLVACAFVFSVADLLMD